MPLRLAIEQTHLTIYPLVPLKPPGVRSSPGAAAGLSSCSRQRLAQCSHCGVPTSCSVQQQWIGSVGAVQCQVLWSGPAHPPLSLDDYPSLQLSFN